MESSNRSPKSYLVTALVATAVLQSFAPPVQAANQCQILFSTETAKKAAAAPAPTDKPAIKKNAVDPVDASAEIYTTVPDISGKTLAEIRDEERVIAQKAYRSGWLATKKHLDEVKRLLNEEFVGSKDTIDEAVEAFSSYILARADKKSTVNGTTKLMTLIGPTGRGKTGPLIRVAELLDLKWEFVTPEEGAVALPLDSLRRLSDQRSDGRPSIFILDEVQHLKPFSELKADRKVPIDNDGLVSLDGQIRYRIVDEIKQRQRSYATLLQALGGGKTARTPLMKPKEYASSLSNLTTLYTTYAGTIKEAKAQIALIQASSPPGKDSAAIMSESLKANGSQLEETLNRYAKKLGEIYQLIDQIKDDQPDFFTDAAFESVIGKRSDTLPNFRKIQNFGSLTAVELVEQYKLYPDEFAMFIQMRAGEMKDSPIETYSNLLLGITGNPIEVIQKVEESFFGRVPPPDRLVRAYKKIATKDALTQWLLERFDPNSPALKSRLRVESLKIILPFSEDQYEMLATRQAKRQEREYQTTLEKMGINGTTLEFDPSIYALIRTEAVNAFAGSREFFPRVEAILQPVTTEVIALVAELSETGSVPQKVTISYDTESRTLRIRSSSDEPQIALDLNLRDFINDLHEPLTHLERERRARFLASMIVVGMVAHHSLPQNVDLSIERPTQFDGWDADYTFDTHSAAQAAIYTAIAGVVGNQIGRPGSLLDKWDAENQTLYIDILKKVINDVHLRDGQFANMNVVRRANARQNLPADQMQAITDANYQNDPKILTATTRRVAKIIINNRALVASIMDHLMQHNTITPEQVGELLATYTSSVPMRKVWIQSLRTRLGPTGPEILVQSQSIKTDPGLTYAPPDLFHGDGAGIFEKLRRLLYGDPGWR